VRQAATASKKETAYRLEQLSTAMSGKLSELGALQQQLGQIAEGGE